MLRHLNFIDAKEAKILHLNKVFIKSFFCTHVLKHNPTAFTPDLKQILQRFAPDLKQKSSKNNH